MVKCSLSAQLLGNTYLLYLYVWVVQVQKVGRVCCVPCRTSHALGGGAGFLLRISVVAKYMSSLVHERKAITEPVFLGSRVM